MIPWLRLRMVRRASARNDCIGILGLPVNFVIGREGRITPSIPVKWTFPWLSVRFNRYSDDATAHLKL
jgi:hypothetical protein